MACDMYRLYQIKAGRDPDARPIDLDDYIWHHQFLEAGLQPDARQAMQLSYRVHSGIDGQSIYQDGIRSDFVQMESMRDFRGDATNPDPLFRTTQAWDEYLSRKGLPCNVTWANREMGTFVIDDVQMVQNVRVLSIQGGLATLNGFSAAIIRVRWNLLKL